MAAASAAPLVLGDPSVQLQGEQLQVQAKVSSNAVKVLAVFGKDAIMLSPKANDIWQGQILLSALAQNNEALYLKAFDMQGNVKQTQLAYFNSQTQNNFNVLGATVQAKTSFLGKVFDPRSLENKFYLIFITGLLMSLVLAIAIKRHVPALKPGGKQQFCHNFSLPVVDGRLSKPASLTGLGYFVIVN